MVMASQSPNTAEPGTVNIAAPHDGHVRCVVLADPDRPRPTNLLSGLNKRVESVYVVHDAPAVLVAIASGTGLLVVSEPADQPRLDALTKAVRRYFPQVLCWGYEPLTMEGRPSLSPLDIKDQEPAAIPNRPAGHSELIHKEHDPVSALLTELDQDEAAEEKFSEAPLLTTEELDMLLGSKLHEPTNEDRS